MKQIITLLFLFIAYSFSAQQIANGNMESWDNLGLMTEEPTNWNGFKSGTGGLVSFGSQQLEQSTAIRSNATGTYCARIWSKSTLGIVANGTMTLGQINMGSTTASSPLNYNYSKTSISSSNKSGNNSIFGSSMDINPKESKLTDSFDIFNLILSSESSFASSNLRCSALILLI